MPYRCISNRENRVCKSTCVFCCDSWLSSCSILQNYTERWQLQGISLCHPQSLLVSDVYRRSANLGFVFECMRSLDCTVHICTVCILCSSIGFQGVICVFLRVQRFALVYAVVLSVHLSVFLSLVGFCQMAERSIIMQTVLSSGTIVLWFKRSRWNSDGITPTGVSNACRVGKTCAFESPA